MKTGYFVWLSLVCPYGSKLPIMLYEYFGNDTEKIYLADREEYIKAGASDTDADSLMQKDFTYANRILDFCAEYKIGILTYELPYYPQRLKSISNPPPVLYYKGNLKLLDDNVCIAMVGTRSCTESGYNAAYKIAYRLAAAGVTIVSGLAAGIDGACTKAALDAGGYAIGVLGTGIERIYPDENKALFEKLAKTGLIMTEFAPFTEPKGKNFPIRNRIISGLSLATTVVEAAQYSGALITAKLTLEQGRRLYAVPGDVNAEQSSGPNTLIKNGAFPVTSAEDILNDFSYLYPNKITESFMPKNVVRQDMPEVHSKKGGGFFRSAKKKASDIPKEIKQVFSQKLEKTDENEKDLAILSESEREIYELLGKEPFSVDDLVKDGHKTDEVLSAVTILEMYGFIKSMPGGSYIKI